MKRPQYGSQQKLVMILIMILLRLQQFPVLFIMYTNKDSTLISIWRNLGSHSGEVQGYSFPTVIHDSSLLAIFGGAWVCGKK